MMTKEELIKEIEEVCEEYGIKNYTINEDLTIDVDGPVYITNTGISKLPLNFNIVKGEFVCHHNRLTTLEGCPKQVNGAFHCEYNRLEDLKGSPKSVDYMFNCSNNYLTSLEGGPEYVGGSFNCMTNELTNLKHSPKEVGSGFFCQYNDILDLDEFDCEVGMYLNCIENPISFLFNKKMDIKPDMIDSFKTFRIVKDGKVNLKRLKYFLSFYKMGVDYINNISAYYEII